MTNRMRSKALPPLSPSEKSAGQVQVLRMRIRSPKLFAAIGRIGAILLRLWIRTLRIRIHTETFAVDPRRFTRGFIYAFWHETMVVPAVVFARFGIHVLISQHHDGEIITQVVRSLGFGVVRGSTTRGAVRALRELARQAGHANLAITPDGPRGPRRQLQDGVVYIASRAGLAVVPIGFAFDRPWRMPSWDRFVAPRPFTRVVAYAGDAVTVPKDADKATLAEMSRRIAAEMDRVTTLAEKLIAGPQASVEIGSDGAANADAIDRSIGVIDSRDFLASPWNGRSENRLRRAG